MLGVLLLQDSPAGRDGHPPVGLIARLLAAGWQSIHSHPLFFTHHPSSELESLRNDPAAVEDELLAPADTVSPEVWAQQQQQQQQPMELPQMAMPAVPSSHIAAPTAPIAQQPARSY